MLKFKRFAMRSSNVGICQPSVMVTTAPHVAQQIALCLCSEYLTFNSTISKLRPEQFGLGQMGCAMSGIKHSFALGGKDLHPIGDSAV